MLSKRLLIIDDTELTSSASNFLSLDQFKAISSLMNTLAYFTFRNQSFCESYVSESVSSNLQRVIQDLYTRDRRMGLFEDGFWIVDKDLKHRLENRPDKELIKEIGLHLLLKVPNTVPFELRARIFR